MANPQVPEPVITNTEDGMVRITVGDEKGWVSSYHLVKPKVNQLIQTWLLKHNKS
jgi:pyruvate/2-oxoglutarate dehydrogenase complex dihydrolipoamide dehydrogenase (E3) component